MNIEKLAEEYEKMIGYIVYVAEKPTEESINHIENELGIKLPSSLINFAKASKNYGNWLASLGPDYDAPNHILSINKMLKLEGKLPANFVVINVGYDEDYSCLDLETYNKIEDEYLITYWAPDVPLSQSPLSENFPSYMQEHINHWSKNA